MDCCFTERGQETYLGTQQAAISILTHLARASSIGGRWIRPGVRGEMESDLRWRGVSFAATRWRYTEEGSAPLALSFGSKRIGN